MLFFSNFILAFTTTSYCLLDYRSLDEFIAPLLEEVEESKMVTDAFKAVPSGLNIACKISENSGGISVDCHVSSCKVLTI